MWRVLTGLHEEGKLSFFLVNHTKFAPEWCFGMAKQFFHHTKVDCSDDIANSVSSLSFVNIPQLVGTLDGTCNVPTYNWSEYFEQHTIKSALKGITKLHHFHFDAKSLGTVYVKERSSDSEWQITLTKTTSWYPSANHLPDIVIPPGLIISTSLIK